MFNVCANCGSWHDKRRIDPSGPYALCPDCDYSQPFNYLPLFAITGASGAGKSAVTLTLMGQLPEFVLLEGDILWRDAFNHSENGYSEFRNICLRVAKTINQSGRPTIISGSTVPGEYEACPEFCYFAGVHYVALVCEDEELTQRLKERPSWRQSGSKEFIEGMLAFNRWFLEHDDQVTVVDTTHLTVAETAESVKTWLTKLHVR